MVTIPDNQIQIQKCIKCNSDGKRWALQLGNDLYFSGAFYCPKCQESFCDECYSHDLEYYDDGEGYPPNILCNECGHWPQ